MQTKTIERYFFFGILLATFLFTFYIFQPFWIVMVLGVSFSIVLYPLYKWFVREKVPSTFASFITVLLFTILLCGPLLGIGVIVFNQSQEAYTFIVTGGKVGPFIDLVENSINKVLPPGATFDMTEKISNAVLYITNNLAKIFSTTLSAFFSFTLMLLSIFYFLKDGKKWSEFLIKLSPLSDDDDRKIIRKLSKAVNGVMKGYILIGLLQGTFMGLGLWLAGVPNPALWGVIAAVASLIPMIGTSLVSVPSVVYLLVTGHVPEGIGLLIWSVMLVGTIDNMLNPYFISGKINIPPLLVLFSVLGGISLLGPIGVLMGPLTLSLLYALLTIYKEEFSGN